MSKTAEITRLGLVRRIHRLIAVSERYKLHPTRSEAYYVLSAIEHLRNARYEDGFAAIAAAEQRVVVPDSAPSISGLHDGTTASDLRTALRLVIRSEE